MLRALTFLAATALFGQPTERTLTFRYAESPADMQETFNVLRALANISDASLDRNARTITLRATPDLLDSADWIFHEMERPAQPSVPNSEMHELQPTGLAGDVLCVYFLSQVTDLRGIQEIVNAVRSTANIQRIFPVSRLHAIAMRGAPEDVTLAKWELQELDKAAPATSLAIRSYPAATDFAARIYFLGNTRSPEALQEIVNATRSVADVQRFFPINQSSAIVLRGSPAQAQVADWLIAQLDRPSTQPKAEYQGPADSAAALRLFHPNVAGPDELQDVVNRIRQQTQAQRVYPVRSLSLIAFRGTADQAATAEQICSSSSQH
jgi:hypothetical protein